LREEFDYLVDRDQLINQTEKNKIERLTIKIVRMVSLKAILIKIQIVQQKNIRLEGDIEEINNYEL
jgi:hypothetical protein